MSGSREDDHVWRFGNRCRDDDGNVGAVGSGRRTKNGEDSGRTSVYKLTATRINVRGEYIHDVSYPALLLD